MLDLLYIGLVVLPLTIAAAALLLLAYRGLRREKAEAPPADIRAVGRAVLETLGPDPEEPPALLERPTLADLTAMVAERAAPAPVAPAPLPPLPPVSAAETKRCPDCAEEVLAAARVCKHCRYRFDEPDWRSALSA